MCLNIALGVMSTVASAMAQGAAADRQNEAYRRNAANSNQDAVEKYAQNQMQEIQEAAKATQARIDNKAEVVKAKGTALASTENSGSSTNSVLHDLERQGAKNDNITNVNERNAKIQADANRTSIKNEAQGRIDGMSTAEGPSLVQTAISGLGAVAPYVGKSKYKGSDHGGSVNG